MADMRIILKRAAAVSTAAVLFFIGCVPSKKYVVERTRGITVKETSYIRVMIFKTARPVSVSGDGGLRVTNMQTRSVEHETNIKKAVFSPDKVKTPVLVESGSKILNVNGASYRGMIELRNSLGVLSVINVVRMEDYLISVVPSESSPGWPKEALKAQAVAARTYAYYYLLKKNNDIYDLDATTKFQVYRGVSAEHESTTSAVQENSGEIMTCKNLPIQAFFHSTCGGSTVDNSSVWGGEQVPYLSAVKCDYCSRSPYYRWEEDLSFSEIARYIISKYSSVGKIQNLSLKRSNNRVLEVSVRHSGGLLQISGNDFRSLIPEKKLKSLAFEAKKQKKMLHIIGSGWGHGVGMCQYGAKGLAEKGRSYRDILGYYYKKISFVKMNNGQ